MQPLKVLFSDNHLLVVDKAAGIATMGAESGAPTLARIAADYIRQKYNKPGNAFIGVVSRLDRLVSGVLVLARTSKSASRLSDQIRRQDIGKHYVAIVEGNWAVDGKSHELVDWIAKDEAAQRMRVVNETHPGAQLAQLRARALAVENGLSLLQLELITGRKHQIRLQLAEHGTPVFGDAKYGGRRKFGEGIALHCREVTMRHPTRGEQMTFRSSPLLHWHNIPNHFENLLKSQ